MLAARKKGILSIQSICRCNSMMLLCGCIQSKEAAIAYINKELFPLQISGDRGVYDCDFS